MSERIIKSANETWQDKLELINEDPDHIVSPRGMEVKEITPGTFTLKMPAYIDLIDRQVNYPFMFSEAEWIVSGSNKLSEVSRYMKGYSRYSDDGTFMRGAYGPKIVDQLGYVVDALENDLDSRQAVINIWRERPGKSKDIPCTTNMQFLVRDHVTYEKDENGEKILDEFEQPIEISRVPSLDMITTMRSQDIVMGYTYDIFTFSMVAKAVQVLLKERGINIDLGYLTVTAGSMHMYSDHYEKSKKWIKSQSKDGRIRKLVDQLTGVETYYELIHKLGQLAYIASNLKEDNDYR